MQTVPGMIVFGLLARDCRDNLERNIVRVLEAGSFFSDYRVVVYENDSKDGTDDLIRKWAAENDKVVGICEITGERTIPDKSQKCPFPMKSVRRIERMCIFRNRVLDELGKRFSTDYFCFIDIDIYDFKPYSLAKAVLTAPSNWGGLFANGRVLIEDFYGHRTFSPFQYDSYAFMDERINYKDTGDWCIHRHFHAITSLILNRNIMKNPFLPCSSAFNGIGIYRWSVIKNLRYRVEQTRELKAVNASFCEHVPFNADVRSLGFGLYVVRDMEVVCIKEKRKFRRFSLWKKQIRTYLRFRFGGNFPISRIGW